MTETLFYNVWRTRSASDKAGLIDAMRDDSPKIAAKPGFHSLTVLEGEDDRVIVEGRWASRAAFDAAIADDEGAQKSRLELEKFGRPEAALFTEAFHVPADPPFITFIQVWRVGLAENQRALLETMRTGVQILATQPGFISMNLYTSLDGLRTVTIAQWVDESSFTHAAELPEAKRSYDEMLRFGTPDGTLYRRDAAFQ